MKADELRIGNYIRTILSKNDYDIVTSISTQKVKDGIYETVCVNYEYQDKSILLHHCSPIPLSEQWLLSVGFEEVYKSPMHSTYSMEDVSFYYYFWYENKKQYASFGGLEIDCKHVHQLQNLYWCLCGKEL